MIRTLSIFTLALVGIGILYLTQLHQQTQNIGTSLSPSTTSYDTLKTSTISTSEHQHEHEHDDIHDHELHAGHDHHEHLDETDDAEHAAARRAKRAKKDFHHHRGITKEKEDQIHREMEELHRLMMVQEENIKNVDAAEGAEKDDTKEAKQTPAPTSTSPPTPKSASSTSKSQSQHHVHVNPPKPTPTPAVATTAAAASSKIDSSTEETFTSKLKKITHKKTDGRAKKDPELDGKKDKDIKKKTKVS